MEDILRPGGLLSAVIDLSDFRAEMLRRATALHVKEPVGTRPGPARRVAPSDMQHLRMSAIC